MNRFARITALGSYVPEQILRNSDLEQMVDTNDEWIVQRTGMRERRIAANDEYTSDMSVAAVLNLAERYAVNLHDVDMIIVATHTPDFPFPSVAARLQHRLHIQGSAAAFDLNAVCAGFTYGLHMANSLIASGQHRKILLVAADTMSKVLDYTDRSTCILFGDAAGAVLIEAVEADGPFFLGAHFGTQGEGGIHVYRSGLSSALDGRELIGNGAVVQNGREVYRWAVTEVPHGIKQLLHKTGTSLDDIDWFIPHSANMRMIESICEKSGIDIDRTLTSMEWYGNTSAATIPLALDLAVKDGRVMPGNRMLLYGFGGGLVSAGILLHF